MQVKNSDLLQLQSEEDIVRARQRTRVFAQQSGLSLVDQTKIVTAASELARNTVVYGGGGKVLIEAIDDRGRAGVRLTFEDQGPGIADVDLAMRDGFSSGTGMGLGLSGAKRLANEFKIDSRLGEGTTVSIVRWKA
jgi:serine/threonine-protein kinase RsbT